MSPTPYPTTAAGELRALVRGVVRGPDPVVSAAGRADVVATVGFARRHGLRVAVRADHTGGAVVLDLSAMRGVAVDPLARTAVVAGGATWADVDGATQPYGLAVPGGRISSSGVAGLTLRGGEGWLSGRHGRSCDNLLQAELVTADGGVLTVDHRREPDLFWALRGRGGTVGVVTSLTFRLHPIPPLVLGGLLAYPLAAAPRVLAVLAELVAASGGDLGGAAAFLHAPPAPYVPGDVVGRPVLAVVPAYFGGPAAGQAVLGPLRTEVAPLVDAVGPVPYVALQRQLDAGDPPGTRTRHASASVRRPTDQLLSDLQDAAARMPGPLSEIVVVPPSLGGHRGRWLVHALAKWRDAEVGTDDAAARWADAVVAATRAADGPTRWTPGAADARRLQAVTARWDPDGLFR
ncbi:FAD-binding oxidoreductase [Pseudonocardia sp. CA-107938]|uniref:FAD-binding oxidoreductase n=1 Tax=Pseudonocardia sp. CA-107938 TaxID=3240021 RepID=UPI003D8BB92D